MNQTLLRLLLFDKMKAWSQAVVSLVQITIGGYQVPALHSFFIADHAAFVHTLPFCYVH